MFRETTSPSGPSEGAPGWSVLMVAVLGVLVGCVLMAVDAGRQLAWAPLRPLTPAEHVTLTAAIRLRCDAPITVPGSVRTAYCAATRQGAIHYQAYALPVWFFTVCRWCRHGLTEHLGGARGLPTFTVTLRPDHLLSVPATFVVLAHEGYHVASIQGQPSAQWTESARCHEENQARLAAHETGSQFVRFLGQREQPGEALTTSPLFLGRSQPWEQLRAEIQAEVEALIRMEGWWTPNALSACEAAISDPLVGTLVSGVALVAIGVLILRERRDRVRRGPVTRP